MSASLRRRVEHTLRNTVDQVESGDGKWAVRLSSIYLDEIQSKLGGVVAGEEIPRFALRVHVIEDDPGGPEVTAAKKRDGVFAITDSMCILSHDLSWGRTYTQGYRNSGLRAEPVITRVKGKSEYAFRLIDGIDRILISLVPVSARGDAMLEAIRDRILEIVRGENLVSDS